MKRIEVEAISEATNAAVVRLPYRNYPGILIQGDSLAGLTNTARRAREAVNAGRPEEASDELAELCELLDAYREEYERAVCAAGLELPYVVSKDRDK
jgi:hypothetical protein